MKLSLLVITILFTVLFSALAPAQCVLPAETECYTPTPSGPSKVVNEATSVIIFMLIPPKELRQSLSEKTGQDWADALIIKDEDERYLLIHQDCMECK